MLGEELRAARLRAGLTQEELAHRANVDRSYISQLEHNLKSPPSTCCCACAGP